MIINVEAYLEVCTECMNVGGPNVPLYRKYSTRELTREDLATLFDREYPRLLVDTWKGESWHAGVIQYDFARNTLVVSGGMRAGTQAYMKHLVESGWIPNVREIALYPQLPVSEDWQAKWDATRREQRAREVDLAVEAEVVFNMQ